MGMPIVSLYMSPSHPPTRYEANPPSTSHSNGFACPSIHPSFQTSRSMLLFFIPITHPAQLMPCLPPQPEVEQIVILSSNAARGVNPLVEVDHPVWDPPCQPSNTLSSTSAHTLIRRMPLLLYKGPCTRGEAETRIIPWFTHK